MAPKKDAYDWGQVPHAAGDDGCDASQLGRTLISVEKFSVRSSFLSHICHSCHFDARLRVGQGLKGLEQRT